jgi:hypothetical protein
MLPQSMPRWSDLAPLAFAATFALALIATQVAADPAAYEPGLDPGIGVNLIAWSNFGASGEQIWEDAVQDIYDSGLRAVSISPLRFVDPNSGAIRLDGGSTVAPDLVHVEAGVARAAALGMVITINPFIEPDGFSRWRAKLDRRCDATGADLAAAFPPCASTDADTVHACLASAAALRACEILDGADSLGASCVS